VVALPFSLGMFYLFHHCAAADNEVCLLYLGTGIFFFFRTIANAAHTITRAQLQRATLAISQSPGTPQ